MPDHRIVRAAMAFAVVIGALGLAGCAVDEPRDADGIVHVPAEAPTIAAAVALVPPGGMVLIAAGVYREQVVVTTPDVTVRGEDRNAVVIDGEGRRSSGIVATADGATIQNLTVRNTTFYGVLVTGLRTAEGTPTAHGGDEYTHLDPTKSPPVQRFLIDHVTASNNGLYGIYAFDAQHGVISNSYASGSADSGFYVGQCRECDILVEGNVAERNAVGFENANASDSVVIVGNRFASNRVGMTLLSNYQEALTPQRANDVVGNLIAANVSADSPAQADGAFGIGIGLSGGRENHLARNLVVDNPQAGVVLRNTEDLSAVDNVFDGNSFSGNGIDVADVSAERAPASGTCVTGDATLLPADLGSTCGTDATQTPADAALLPAVEVPPGISFLKVPAPLTLPGLDDVESRPERLPDAVVMPDLDSIAMPTRELLAEQSGTS